MTTQPYGHVDASDIDSERLNPGDFGISEHVRVSHSSEGAVVLDIMHGQMFRINPVGSRILELLRQELGESEIAERLTQDFGIDRASAQADTREFLEELKKHHLLSTRER